MKDSKTAVQTITPAHRAEESGKALDMETLVSLCKRRGFIFQSSEVYGGFGSTWDYGPLGVELKRNIKEAWWRDCVKKREDMVGLDSSILMHPQTWVASGHLQEFTDPLVECKNCHLRFRADEIDNDTCPNCGTVGQFTPARQFHLMFKTFVGPVEDEAALAYLRPETAQGIFVNFLNVLNTTRRKLPFGIAQMGKAFRNEITTGNFLFRTREFEQMEIEYFVRPGEDEKWLDYWVKERLAWYGRYGIRPDNLRLRQHGPEELSHYSKATYDIEYKFPFGWAEIEGIANRTDYDLRRHSEESGKDLSYFDPDSGERLIPYVIEPSGGVDRAFLAFLTDAYHQEVVRGEKRTVLRLHSQLAPIKAAVFPLLRNREELVALAKRIAAELRPHLTVMYDDTGSIGRLYRRQDETGTPYCITVDVKSLVDNAVTIRDRDTMEQVRLPIAEVKDWLLTKLAQH